MRIKNYAMCNAAISAMAYDGVMVSKEWLDTKTPDTDGDARVKREFGLANKLNPPTTSVPPPHIFNFTLASDSALNIWLFNNRLFKPDGANGYFYFDNHPPKPPAKLFRFGLRSGFTPVLLQAEGLGYVTKSRSGPAGSEFGTLGCIPADNRIKMSDYGFGNMHGAEWLMNIQATHRFWETLDQNFESGRIKR